MSSIVRHELETYIDTQRRVLSRRLRNVIAEAVAIRNMELVAKVESLESAIQTFRPSKAKYVTPEEYVDALRSYAFVLSLVQTVISDRIDSETIEIALQLIELATRGEPIGKVAEDAKRILSGLGSDMYFRGCISYLNVLVGKVKEFDPQEIFIAREALGSIITIGKPVINISELSKHMGVREKDLRELIKRISKADPNIVYTKKYVFSKNALKDYLQSTLEEKKYLLVSDLSKEWSLGGKEVMQIIDDIRHIFPDLLMVNGLITTPIRMREYLLSLLDEKKSITVHELSAHIGIKEKDIKELVKRIMPSVPGVLYVGEELLVLRDELNSLLKTIFGERIFIFVDEVAGRLGLSRKTAKDLLNIASRVTGNIIISGDKVYLKEQISRAVEQSIVSGKEVPFEKMDSEVKVMMEDEVYKSIARALDEFAKKLGVKP